MGREPIRRALAAMGLAMALAAPAAGADGPAYVVKDVTAGTERGVSSHPGPFFDLGHTTLFVAQDQTHGREIWRTDGTSAGTRRITDVVPGPADGVTFVGHAADGILYFGTVPGALWRSDGTAAGTFAVADVQPWHLIADGNRLYVMVMVDYEDVDLFRIDLPSGAKTLLGSFRGHQLEPSLTLLGGRLYFAADADHREGLWTSDGTPEGTRLVTGVQLANHEGGNDETEIIAAGGQLFFMGNYNGWELFRSDGTEAGTYQVRNIGPGERHGFNFNDYTERANPFFAALGDMVIFMADDGVHGLEPWRSDGTEAGTVRLADVWPGPIGVDGTDGRDDDHSDVAGAVVRTLTFGDQVYFTARSGEERLELWATDGTPENTRAVKALDGLAYPSRAVAAAQHIYLSGYRELWISDGTEAGTVQIPAAVSDPQHLTPTLRGIVFNDVDDLAGYEPWVSDGTAAGTHLLLDIARGVPGLDPEQLTDFNGTLLFSGDDAPHGRELWRSDGTAAGTRLVADLNASAHSSFPGDFAVSGATAYFSAGGLYDDRLLWRSDGTTAGTRLVGGPADPIALASDDRGGVYFFSDEPSQASFWHSDGTAAGTQVIRAGDADVWIQFQEPALLLGDAALFLVQSSENGYGLWRTNGTAAGTTLLAAPAPPYGRVHHLTRLGDVALFFVNAESGKTALWRTDGTAAGTVAVAEVGAEAGTVAVANGRMYFNAHGYLDYRLWQTDGTPSGTFTVLPEKYRSPAQVASAADRLFTLTARARRTAFGEPGCVDLAETSTDISRFASLGDADGRVIFSEILPSNAQRLWTSNGSRAGTTAIQDLPAPSAARGIAEPRFVRAGERVFFAARQGDSGSELWALPLSVLPPVDVGPCEIPPTPTPVPGRPTPAPFTCPDGNPRCTVLEIEPVIARAGERVTMTAVLHASHLPIAGIQNDLALPEGIALLANDDDDPACVVEPSIDKDSTAYSFQPPYCGDASEPCRAMRALVLDVLNVDPIYDGAVLYRCELQLSPLLEPGDYTLALSNLGASDPDGVPVAMSGIDGVVTVVDESGTRPIGEAGSGGGNGCQTAAPDGHLAPAAWLLLAALPLMLARRRRRP